MTNKNDASSKIRGSGNKSDIGTRKIYSESGAKETINDVSTSIEGDTNDHKAGDVIIIAKASEIDIAELKAEIQPFLEQLAQSPITRKESVATEALKEEIKAKPNLKQRLLNAFKVGTTEALKEIFNHPLVNISVETVKAFIEAD